jgi:hypothetical protein
MDRRQAPSPAADPKSVAKSIPANRDKPIKSQMHAVFDGKTIRSDARQVYSAEAAPSRRASTSGRPWIAAEFLRGYKNKCEPIGV